MPTHTLDAVDRKILVERADHVTVRLDDDVVVRGVRNRTAAGDCREPSAAPRAHPAVDAIVVEKGSATAARGRDDARTRRHGH